MRFYQLDRVPDGPTRYKGGYNAEHKWGLPGLRCPTCGGLVANDAEVYPSVDLSGLPEAKLLEEGWLEEDSERFQRLRELVRPLAPVGAPLSPGAQFGPLVGSARGSFAQIFILYSWVVLIRREALEQLQAEGIRGLKGCRTELRFRQRNAPELLELEIPLHGHFHPDCLSPDDREPCKSCGLYKRGRSKELVLDKASLPEHLDVFRLRIGSMTIIISERFADTLRRLGFEEFSLTEVPVR